jgi:hypothetical protein
MARIFSIFIREIRIFAPFALKWWGETPNVTVAKVPQGLSLGLTQNPKSKPRAFATSCPQGKFVAKDFELRKSYLACQGQHECCSTTNCITSVI